MGNPWDPPHIRLLSVTCKTKGQYLFKSILGHWWDGSHLAAPHLNPLYFLYDCLLWDHHHTLLWLLPSSQVPDQVLHGSQCWPACATICHLSGCSETREVSSHEQVGFSQSRYLHWGLSTRGSQVSTEDGRQDFPLWLQKGVESSASSLL